SLAVRPRSSALAEETVSARVMSMSFIFRDLFARESPEDGERRWRTCFHQHTSFQVPMATEP
ncbi:MAG: hypothetical protein QGG53_12480, partial [Planctomycetota bacterium]|nr:hypothetical protein [Planctomycetota bacterium]